MYIFNIKDLIDIFLVSTCAFYVYKLSKRSGSTNLFVGVLIFIIAWWLASKVMDMKLLGGILDSVMSIGPILFVIIFQDNIRRVLGNLTHESRLKSLLHIFSSRQENNSKQTAQWVIQIVRACESMSRTKTGALIVIERAMSLIEYEKLGDMINANINRRLIENIFFKNSPLHDGAMIISNEKITSCGCILPVSHNSDLPRYLGLRHRSALGIAEETDAIAIVVSEETGKISVAIDGKIETGRSLAELEKIIAKSMNS